MRRTTLALTVLLALSACGRAPVTATPRAVQPVAAQEALNLYGLPVDAIVQEVYVYPWTRAMQAPLLPEIMLNPEDCLYGPGPSAAPVAAAGRPFVPPGTLPTPQPDPQWTNLTVMIKDAQVNRCFFNGKLKFNYAHVNSKRVKVGDRVVGQVHNVHANTTTGTFYQFGGGYAKTYELRVNPTK